MSIFLLNPFLLTPIATFVRSFFDSGITTTPVEVTTTQTTRATINTTETTGDRLAVFWQSINQNNQTGSDQIALLFESPTERQRYNIESKDATDQHSMGGAYAYSGGTNKTFTLDSLEETAATGNEIQDYGLCAIKLVTEDQFQHSAGQSNSTVTTYADKATITLGAGDWLLVASASILQSAVGVAKVRVFDGTTALAERSGTFFSKDVTNWLPFNAIKKVSPTASTTYSLQWGRVATGTASIRQATILAFDLSKFNNHYYAEQFTAQTTTQTTNFAGTGLSSAFTFANPSNKHLILATAVSGSSANNRSSLTRLYNVTAAVDYSGVSRREAQVVTERYDIFVGRIVTFASATETIEWEHSIAGGAGTSTLDDMVIAILDLGTT